MTQTSQSASQVQRISPLVSEADATDLRRKKPRWTMLAFWVGAIIDGIMAVAMVYPPLWAWVLKIDGFAPGLRYRIDMGVGAALMFGWTALLIWGALKPVERRDVLLLTAFPVVTGILLTAISAVATGLSTAAALTTTLVFLPLIIILVVVGYLAARRADPTVGQSGRAFSGG